MTAFNPSRLSIREQVAAAIYASDHDGACEWAKLRQADQELYSRNADAAITAFLYIAAKQGRHMVPDKATKAMVEAGIRCSHGQEIPGGSDGSFQMVYRAMVAEADKFEWGR
jgi:hypothetical protein